MTPAARSRASSGSENSRSRAGWPETCSPQTLTSDVGGEMSADDTTAGPAAGQNTFAFPHHTGGVVMHFAETGRERIYLEHFWNDFRCDQVGAGGRPPILC